MKEEDRPAKRGRGRPRGDGRLPGWKLLQISVALEAYQRARARSEKHEIALKESVQAVKTFFPGKRCSVTLIKDILAKYMPTKLNHLSMLVAVTRRAPDQLEANPSSPPSPAVLYGIGFGERPGYKRANAAKAAHPKHLNPKPSK